MVTGILEIPGVERLCGYDLNNEELCCYGDSKVPTKLLYLWKHILPSLLHAPKVPNQT